MFILKKTIKRCELQNRALLIKQEIVFARMIKFDFTNLKINNIHVLE